ncbi:MAG: HAMP domain-containing histidine kinase [Anaeroplasmataceae bacterium]|nr:HAMP domain-containing histidine kinase [Anaeroplasmataceae bacterium]
MHSFWFIVIGIILSILFIALIIKVYVLKLSYREIKKEFKEISTKETNAKISISSCDQDVVSMVEEINTCLANIREKELKYQNGNYELQKSITNIIHDIRTPLTAILGYTELLDQEDLTENQKQSLQIIKTRTKDLIYLSEQLFDYLYQKDQGPVEKEVLCLNQELENAMLNYYALFQANQIEPHIDITPVKIYRKVNKEMLVRIFDNLIYNMIKYGEHKVKVTLTMTGRIIFSNPAPNLDSVGLAKIFDRYTTLENARKSAGGAGLSIVRQFVELNDGKITASIEDHWLVLTIIFK